MTAKINNRDYNKRRWLILVASCLVNLCIGSLYTWSVFAGPLAEHINNVQQLSGTALLSAGSLSIIFIMSNAFAPVPMVAGGFLSERIGPRRVVMIGGVLFGAGFLLCGFANSVLMLALGYGGCVGVGVAATYGCTVNNLLRFFPDKRGLIGGLATASYGISSVLIPPIANALIQSADVSVAMRELGAVFLLIILGCAMLIDRCPDTFIPLNYRQDKRQANSSETQMTWKEMLRCPVFYVMLSVLICGAFSGIMVISQAASVAQNLLGIDAAGAALAVSVLALSNTFGRIACGRISDDFGRINTITFMLFIAVAGMLTLYYFGTIDWPFYTGICCVGLSFGALMGIYPGFTGDQFGMRYNNINFGFMFFGFSLAGIAGPAAMGAIFNATGSYRQAFCVAACLAAAGMLLTLLYRVVVKHMGGARCSSK